MSIWQWLLSRFESEKPIPLVRRRLETVLEDDRERRVTILPPPPIPPLRPIPGIGDYRTRRDLIDTRPEPRSGLRLYSDEIPETIPCPPPPDTERNG